MHVALLKKHEINWQIVHNCAISVFFLLHWHHKFLQRNELKIVGKHLFKIKIQNKNWEFW